MSEAEPRLSASVLLLRQAKAIETFMVVRHAGIAQFGGALVFPGGCVDAGDENPEWAAYCVGGADYEARELKLRVAAIREAFEESGVLLARGQGTGEFIDPARMEALGQHRQALDERQLDFLDFVRGEHLQLATDRLLQVGHWITPRPLPKRFDTVFFAAHVPHALALVHDGREAVASEWKTAQAFLDEAAAGDHELIFPTRCNLLRVAQYDSVSALLVAESERPNVTVLPKAERQGDQIILKIPANAGYPIHSERIPRT